MIKKIIFSSAIILSLTTHHTMCMDTQDDKATISAKPADLDKELEKEVKKNAELTNKRGYVQHYHIPERGGIGIECAFPPAEGDSLIQSNARLVEIHAQRQQLEAEALKKAE